VVDPRQEEGGRLGDIVVMGGGGHAKVLVSVLKKLSWRLIGYSDRRDAGPLLGVPWLGTDEALAGVLARHSGCSAVVGVGKVDESAVRADLQAVLVAAGFLVPVVVSPHAVVNEEVGLGAGTMVFDGAVVNSGTAVGAGCILNTGSIVEHDCVLGDDVHIAPGATVSGGSRIGDHCMIGAGATVIHGVEVCAGCVIGAGAVVAGDVAAPGVYAGVPARRIS
jgi:sugar O-acyltransferase (sialic acid O-acetyltransferase NeuD family)